MPHRQLTVPFFCTQRKTGECFGLNGLIFLGSILLWEYGLAPGMHLLLQAMGNTAGTVSSTQAGGDIVPVTFMIAMSLCYSL